MAWREAERRERKNCATKPPARRATPGASTQPSRAITRPIGDGLWPIKRSKIRLTGRTSKIEARNGRTGKTIEENIARWEPTARDRKSTRLNSSHQIISYAVFCLKKKKNKKTYSRNSGVEESRARNCRPGISLC